jgi:hypothetical protein
MADVVTFGSGGYRYLSAVFQYSGGVAAEPGYAIERARLHRPVPLEQGFAQVEEHLAAIGRPTAAFAACELRSPAPFTEEGFVDFNRFYVQTLERWGIYRDGVNPVARTNVCPAYGAPDEPVLHAFTYTVPTDARRPSFIVAGSGEVAEGRGSYAGRIVREGETTPDALRDKLRFVVAEMTRRLGALRAHWRDARSTQLYTVHDVGALVGPELAATGVAPDGLTWHFARPPVVGLEVEMDVRGAARELVL